MVGAKPFSQVHIKIVLKVTIDLAFRRNAGDISEPSSAVVSVVGTFTEIAVFQTASLVTVQTNIEESYKLIQSLYGLLV